MVFKIMVRNIMIDLAFPDISQVFINPNGKCSVSASYILIVARTSQ